MTSKQWWYEVINTTYKTTENLNQVEPDELEQLMPDLFSMLYGQIFSSKEGWMVREDALYTLKRLREWRDLGSGPKIGIVSNFDGRLPSIFLGSYHEPIIHVLLNLLQLS